MSQGRKWDSVQSCCYQGPIGLSSPKWHCSSNIAVPLVSADVFVVTGSEVGQCAELLLSRPKRAKRYCSSSIAVPLVSADVFVVSGSEVGQCAKSLLSRLSRRREGLKGLTGLTGIAPIMHYAFRSVIRLYRLYIRCPTSVRRSHRCLHSGEGTLHRIIKHCALLSGCVCGELVVRGGR